MLNHTLRSLDTANSSDSLTINTYTGLQENTGVQA
jgi:hypothetical protein